MTHRMRPTSAFDQRFLCRVRPTISVLGIGNGSDIALECLHCVRVCATWS